ncbi:MAG: hypothetical protein ACE5GJ_12205 [Gemmatimonadota bacterium]
MASQVIPREVSVLVRMEFRRMREAILRIIGMTVAWFGALFVLGKVTPGTVSFALVTLGLSAGMVPFSTSMRDKLDGTMEFLASLPADPEKIAAGRFLFMALHAVVPGFMMGVGVILGMSLMIGAAEAEALRVAAPQLLLVLSVATSWFLIFVGLSTGHALVTRFELGRIMGWPARIAIFVMIVLTFAGEEVSAMFRPIPHWFGATPWALPALGVLVLAACVGAIYVSFRLTASALRNFRPDPTELPLTP